MKSFNIQYKNEDGAVIVVVLLILVLITISGVAAVNTSISEKQIAAGDHFQKIAFYASEAARGYVQESPLLYGPDNIILNAGLYYPNNDNPAETILLSTTQSFNGEVVYTGFSNAPRDSGYEAGTFKAHKYKMLCDGNGPRNSKSQIEVGFYRIGF